jgi:hypothetical protein
MKVYRIFLSLICLSLFVIALVGASAQPAYAKGLDVSSHTIVGKPIPPTGGGGGECTSGDMGVFKPVYAALAPLARNLWAFLVGLVVIVAVLGGMYFALTGTGGAIMGGAKPTAGAIIGVLGLVVMVLMVFLILPNLGTILCSFQPQPPF